MYQRGRNLRVYIWIFGTNLKHFHFRLEETFFFSKSLIACDAPPGQVRRRSLPAAKGALRWRTDKLGKWLRPDKVSSSGEFPPKVLDPLTL